MKIIVGVLAVLGSVMSCSGCTTICNPALPGSAIQSNNAAGFTVGVIESGGCVAYKLATDLSTFDTSGGSGKDSKSWINDLAAASDQKK